MLKKEHEEAIRLIANVAETFARNAGVGAMETAGMIVSCAANDPKFLRAFFENPTEAMLSDRFDQLCNGCLTHHAVNGEIVDPKNHAESRRRPTAT